LEELMEHATVNNLKRSAKVTLFPATPSKMSRRERLERWATILEQYKGSLRPLIGIEYLSNQERALLRDAGTPLTVAFHDPVLREEGLASDRLGDGTAFFGLTNRQAHRLLCHCNYHDSMTAAEVAARVRSVANQITLREFWHRIRSTIGAAR
jgi:hypothetical protein